MWGETEASHQHPAPTCWLCVSEPSWKEMGQRQPSLQMSAISADISTTTTRLGWPQIPDPWKLRQTVNFCCYFRSPSLEVVCYAMLGNEHSPHQPTFILCCIFLRELI